MGLRLEAFRRTSDGKVTERPEVRLMIMKPEKSAGKARELSPKELEGGMVACVKSTNFWVAVSGNVRSCCDVVRYASNGASLRVVVELFGP